MKFCKTIIFCLCFTFAYNSGEKKKPLTKDTTIQQEYSFISISKAEYKDQLYGFWLSQSIENWTGLVTEMDKIGNIGEIKTGVFTPEVIGENQIYQVSETKI